MEATNLIKEHYIREILSTGKRPQSVYIFMQELGMEERFFFEHYSSFFDLEKAIWRDFFVQTIEKMTSDSIYGQYSVREKVLALNYTMLETLKEYRSFVLFSAKQLSNLSVGGDVWEGMQKEFDLYVRQLVTEGIYTGEVTERPFLTDRYAKVLWWEFAFVLRFWTRDQSTNFEKTDALIEKSVNLALDVLGRNVADSAFDLVRFLWSVK